MGLWPMTTLSPPPTLRFFLVAGEASGDALGAALITDLRQRFGAHAEFYGVGGNLMRAAGQQQLFTARDLAVMGFFELIPHLPRLWTRLRQTVRAVRALNPSAVITIDAPGFNKLLAKKLGRGRWPLIHYVAPSVWAWRPGRAKTMARLFDALFCLLPFEPPYFTKHGLRAEFVGHPIVTSDWQAGDAALARARYGLAANAPILCLLPGSRQQEIKRLLPLFLAVAARLQQRWPRLELLLPTLPELADWIKQQGALPKNLRLVTEYADKKHVFAASTLALAASGTVSLECNRAGLPLVVAYRVSALSALLARRLVKLRYFTLANILLNRAAIPEFFQEQATVDNIEAACAELLQHPEICQQQRDAAHTALEMLRPQQQGAAMAVITQSIPELQNLTKA